MQPQVKHIFSSHNLLQFTLSPTSARKNDTNLGSNPRGLSQACHTNLHSQTTTLRGRQSYTHCGRFTLSPNLTALPQTCVAPTTTAGGQTATNALTTGLVLEITRFKLHGYCYVRVCITQIVNVHSQTVRKAKLSRLLEINLTPLDCHEITQITNVRSKRS